MPLPPDNLRPLNFAHPRTLQSANRKTWSIPRMFTQVLYAQAHLGPLNPNHLQLSNPVNGLNTPPVYQQAAGAIKFYEGNYHEPVNHFQGEVNPFEEFANPEFYEDEDLPQHLKDLNWQYGEENKDFHDEVGDNEDKDEDFHDAVGDNEVDSQVEEKGIEEKDEFYDALSNRPHRRLLRGVKVSNRRVLKGKGGGGGRSGKGKGGGGGGKGKPKLIRENKYDGGSSKHGSGGKGARKGKPADLPTLRGKSPKNIKKLSSTADKSIWTSSRRFGSSSGCGYVGMPCRSFVYQHKPRDKTTNRHYYYYGYHPYPHSSGGGNYSPTKVDDNWNMMATLPYVAKSALFTENALKPHGNPFDDVEDSPQITVSKVKTVTMYENDGRLTSIRFHYESDAFGNDKSVAHGDDQDGKQKKVFDLADDENIIGGSFSNCKVADHPRLCAVRWVTSKGREFSAGDRKVRKDATGTWVYDYTTMAPKGFSIAGLFGKQGDNIDLVGVVAINLDLMNAYKKMYEIPEEYQTKYLNGDDWYPTQYPGIASSYVVGGSEGSLVFNNALLGPYNLYEMRINKVEMYGNGMLTGIKYTYDDESTIMDGVEIPGEEIRVVDLGKTGRIEKITVAQYRPWLWKCIDGLCKRRRLRRLAGAKFTFTDKDGNHQEISIGTLDKKQQDEFIIPPGSEFIASVGASGRRLDNIGFLIRTPQTGPAVVMPTDFAEAPSPTVEP